MQTEYDLVAYPSAPLPRTHPHRLGGLALLHGYNAPRRTRILDIGCGAGRNLIWIAATIPDAERCLGVDLAGSAIAGAKSFAKLAGVSNAEFEETDFGSVTGEFDVIIASGLYSWMESKADLLAFVASHLSEDGIAYVNFHEEHRPWRGELLRHRDPSRIPDLADLDPGLIHHDAMAPVSDPVSMDEFLAALPPCLQYLCDARIPPEDTFHEAVLIRAGRAEALGEPELWWITEESFPGTVTGPPPEAIVDFQSAPRPLTVVPESKPFAWPPARRLAGAGETAIMNFFGAMVELDEEDRAMLASLDGTNAAEGPTIAFFGRAGLLVTPEEARRTPKPDSRTSCIPSQTASAPCPWGRCAAWPG